MNAEPWSRGASRPRGRVDHRHRWSEEGDRSAVGTEGHGTGQREFRDMRDWRGRH